jgi:hypothetical protein
MARPDSSASDRRDEAEERAGRDTDPSAGLESPDEAEDASREGSEKLDELHARIEEARDTVARQDNLGST